MIFIFLIVHLGTESDLVQFLSGILLTGDMRVKEWLAEYIRNAQKVDS